MDAAAATACAASWACGGPNGPVGWPRRVHPRGGCSGCTPRTRGGGGGPWLCGGGSRATATPRDAIVLAAVAVLAARHAAHVAAVAAGVHKRRRLDAGADAGAEAVAAVTPYALPSWYVALVVPAVADRRLAAVAAAAAAVAAAAAAVVADAAEVAARYATAPDMVARRVASKRYARARRLRAAAAAADAQIEAAAAAEMHRRRALAGITDAVQSGARAAVGGRGSTTAGAPGTPAGLVAFRYDRGEGAFAYSGGICGGGRVRRRQLAKYSTVAEVAAPGGLEKAVGFARTAPMFHTKVMNRWA
ncbi:hypothetical protein MMPV_007729 [Pyropia vietnamensis]